MNGIVLELAAFVVCVFCFVDCVKGRRLWKENNTRGLMGRLKDRRFVFCSLLVCLMTSALSDAVNLFLEEYITDRSPFAIEALNEVYFIVHTILPALYVLFLINVTESVSDKGGGFFALFFAPVIAGELIVASNPFTHLIFYVDENVKYARGSQIWTLYVMAYIYVVIGTVFFFKYKRRISRIDSVTTFIILFISTVGILIQGLFSIQVELFFDSIALLGFLLLLNEHNPRTGRKNGKISRGFIVVLALLFMTIVTMNIAIIYTSGTDQTNKIGEVQINNLKGEMQQTLSDSENNLLRYSMGLEQLINDSASTEEIERYIREQKKYYLDLSGGSCFSAYAAAAEWTIIPDFDMPKEYHAVERLWYIGAKMAPGQVYISEPYIDADTGNLCYTFSYLLSDENTVAAMDYTLSSVQDIVGKMGGNNDQFAMIVTDSGIVAGCSDETYQGVELKNALSQYAEVFERVKASNEHRSFRTTIDASEKIVFDSETDNGWKLIIVVDYDKFYSEILRQMIMLGTIDFMMVTVIIVFYIMSVNHQEKAERTLASTENFIASLSGDIKNPLQTIITISDGSLKSETGDRERTVREILDAGRLLQERLNNLFSYSDMLKEHVQDAAPGTSGKKRKASFSSRYIRNGIIGIILTALLVGLALCLVMTSNWGYERISKEASRYNSEVTLWMQQKQSILGMFADVIVADPTVLDDYDAAVKWLDDITKNYNEMTFAYMANPYNKKHAIIMNNGWVPEPDYKVEERQWYIDTERSGDGYSISAPYFDAQTGLYCITFSRAVYSQNGEFLGMFAIDCLLDKLIDVLDTSYTSDSYAFMVDQDGTIINHPFKEYQISTDNRVNIEDTEYADAFHKGNVFLMRDHDGRFAACYTEKSELSGFTVVVIQSWWSIYGTVLIIAVVFIFMLVASIVGIVALINRFIRWQEEANATLQETASKAVAAEKAKSRFLAQMSHEIRTPINAVLGMNEMILRESNDASVREYSENIHAAGKNLLSLINTILDFSKIEEGRMEIIPVKYDTATMIENMVNSIFKRAADKGLVFEAHIDNTLPTSLYGDDMRVTQVAVNLLTNAVKYTREGRVDLYIDGKTAGDNSVELMVRVKDTGIGIKEEDMGRLFESFTRLEETKNRTIEGTGLGMTIVNRLLEMMGSELEVHSVYGEGSEFAFKVKQDIIDSRPIGDYETKARETLEHEENGTYLYAPEARLLIVDDNDMNLKVAVNLLKLNGIKPELALSGAEALEKMKANTYDVIMLDHMMPEMDGIETLQAAREQGIIAEKCSVIVLTANAVVGAREEYIKVGFDDYITKPIEVKALESILGKYLPQDKVEYRSRTEKNAPEASDSSSGGQQDNGSVGMFSVLEDNGISVKTGLDYCAGDEDFYKTLLKEYSESSGTRTSELEQAFETGDLEMYSIKIHSLKSISRTIGAADLADAAAELEKASKEDDSEFVGREHSRMLEKYRGVVDAINLLDLPSETAGSGMSDDDEIMEFLPQ